QAPLVRLAVARHLARTHPHFFFPLLRPPPPSTLFPYTTLFRSALDFGVRAASEKRDARLAYAWFVDGRRVGRRERWRRPTLRPRSEEHTSELQSRFDLVCRLLLEKKKTEQESQPDRIPSAHGIA